MATTDLERFVEADGRAERIKDVRKRIDAEDISYVYYQFPSVTGRIMGKGVPAPHWETIANKGFQLVYGATANLFIDRHGNYIGYGPEAAELVGIPEPETFAVLPWTAGDGKKLARVWCQCFRNREEREDPGAFLTSDCRGNLIRQQADFEEILEAMDGLPVTVRLLDPPLHEFLPPLHEIIEAEARGTADPEQRVLPDAAHPVALPVVGSSIGRMDDPFALLPSVSSVPSHNPSDAAPDDLARLADAPAVASTLERARAFFFWIWLGGAAFLLLTLLAGLVTLARLARRSRPFGEGRVTALTAELALAMGVEARIPVLQGPSSSMPMSGRRLGSRRAVASSANRARRRPRAAPPAARRTDSAKRWPTIRIAEAPRAVRMASS